MAARTEHTDGRRGKRTLHLVDVDNLLGDPLTADTGIIGGTLAEYRLAARFEPGDHAVVASCSDPAHALAVRAAWPGVLHRMRRGVDGAELALLEEAQWAAQPRRYDRVVLGSDDRIFLVAVDVLRACDIEVQVVSRRDSRSMPSPSGPVGNGSARRRPRRAA